MISTLSAMFMIIIYEQPVSVAHYQTLMKNLCKLRQSVHLFLRILSIHPIYLGP